MSIYLIEKRDSLHNTMYTLRYLMFIVLLHFVLSYSFKLCSTQVGIIRQRVSYKTTVRIVYQKIVKSIYYIEQCKTMPDSIYCLSLMSTGDHIYSCNAVLLSI